MGQAKQRGTYAERIAQAQANSHKYDILLRMYKKYDDPEAECGTLRLRPSYVEAQKTISAASDWPKNDLAQVIAQSIRKWDLNGSKIIKDPKLLNLGGIIVAYLSRFNCWPILQAKYSDQNILIDYYHESSRGSNVFEFVLRGNQGSTEEYDRFEQNRVCFWPTKHQADTDPEAYLSKMLIDIDPKTKVMKVS